MVMLARWMAVVVFVAIKMANGESIYIAQTAQGTNSGPARPMPTQPSGSTPRGTGAAA